MATSLYNHQQRHNEIAGRFKMEWQTPQYNGKNLLLVEGNSDKSFYKHFITDSTEVRSSGEEYGGGCKLLMSVFRELKRISSITCVAIKDSDFDTVNNTTISEDGFFYTDYHDHEMYFLSSTEALIAAMTSLSVSFEEAVYMGLIDSLATITYLKWYNYTNHINLALKSIKVHCLPQDCLCDVTKLVKIAKSKSNQSCFIDMDDFSEFCSTHKWERVFQLVNGHDLLRLLYQYVRERVTGNISIDDFKGCILSYYSIEAFSSTNLHGNVHDWALQHNTTFFK